MLVVPWIYWGAILFIVNKGLFAKEKPPVVLLGSLLLLALLLMWSDVRGHGFGRTLLSRVLWPLQYTMASFTHHLSVVDVDHLRVENAMLKAALMREKLLLMQQQSMVNENQQLRALLALRQHPIASSQAATVLGIAAFGHALTIDKGSDDGVTAGESVLDATGIVGQVVQVDAHRATVL